MKVLRTPDKALAGISDFPFTSHYAEVTHTDGSIKLRVHYIDEGPRDAPVAEELWDVVATAEYPSRAAML